MEFELTDEQGMFQKLARDFADREIEPAAEEIEREGKVPPDMLAKMARVGLLGITAPEEYGGLEQGYLTLILAMEQVHYPCTACTWLLVANELAELLESAGTKEQKDEFLPPAIEGTSLPGGVFTEAATGSYPEMLTTTARLEDGHWVINGTKRFHTFGHVDGPALIFAKTDEDSTSAIIVPKNTEGYTSSKPWGLMGLRGMETVDTFLRDVRVPEGNLIGERGKGFEILLMVTAGGRVRQAIQSVACGQRALDEAIAYAKQRTTTRGPISDMQGHRWLFAEMASRVVAARWLTYRTAYLRERGKDVRTESAMAKLFAGQAGEWVSSQALKIHGAYGYTTEYKIERIYRAAMAQEVIEGTNEVQRSIVGASLVED
jgi:butyryl-CoA dehydrogenase